MSMVTMLPWFNLFNSHIFYHLFFDGQIQHSKTGAERDHLQRCHCSLWNTRRHRPPVAIGQVNGAVQVILANILGNDHDWLVDDLFGGCTVDIISYNGGIVDNNLEN